MGMFDYAVFDFELPNGKKLDLRGAEIQCSIECMFVTYKIKNYGTLGYTKHLPLNPFSILRNTKICFSLSEFSGGIWITFNRLGVITKLEVLKYDYELKKNVIVNNQVVDWPKDQIKQYNKNALKDIVSFMPSRFIEGTPLAKRMYYFFRQYTINWIYGWWSDRQWEKGKEARLASYSKKD